MKTIVLANINRTVQDSGSLDQEVVQVLTMFLETNKVDACICNVTSIQELTDALKLGETTALITNFPPDSTYADAHEPQLLPGFGGHVYASKADSYALSKVSLGTLISQQPSMRTLVITGAPRNSLTDEEIMGLSTGGRIRVVRKADLFSAAKGYENAYTSLVLAFVARSMQELDGQSEEWRSIQTEFAQEQFGAIRVLLLSRSTHRAESICRGLAAAFADISCPLTFTTATTVEEAHILLLRGQIEIVLSVFEDDYWHPILDAVASESCLVAPVCVISAFADIPRLSDRATVIRADSSNRVDARRLAIDLLSTIRAIRLQIAGPGGISFLQKEFLEQLQSTDCDALGRGLRILTAHHRSFLRALSRENNNLNLFIPIGMANELSALLPKALFICDRVVFTQLPVAHSPSLEGELVEVLPLWDLIGAQCGSTIQTAIAGVIRSYAPMFADGRVVFYPSPTMIRVTAANADELAPETKGLIETKPHLSVWQESSAFDQYISADKINAGHVVLADYRPMAEIGRAIAEIEIPYIANVPAHLLGDLLRDNRESLLAFRGRTRKVIDDLIESGSDVESARIRKRFVRELEDGAKELGDKIRLLRNSTAIQSAGGAIVTAISTLAAVSVLDIPTIAAKLLGGGGLSSMALQYITYLMQLKAHRNSPFHVIWRLQGKNSQVKGT